MNWIKENKFLAGFLAATFVGVAVLGFLLLSAKGRYEEVSNQYQEQAGELNRLQSLKPFPAPENLKKIEEQRAEHQQTIVGLQKSLATNEIPVEPLTEVQFQDRLRESVTRVTAKAAERGLKLPEKFYMGFDRYQTEPPRPEAAPLLGRQLKAIELVLMQVIENKGVMLNRIDRPTLPEEDPSRSPAPTAGGGPGGGGGKQDKDKSDKNLLARYPFEINFTIDQVGFQTVLNRIVSNKTQFFIPRVLQVRNEKTAGPERIDPALGAAASPTAPAAPPPTDAAVAGGAPAAPDAAAASATPAATAAPGTAAAPAAPGAPAGPLKYIVGEERLEVTMRLELVDFAEVAAAPAK